MLKEPVYLTFIEVMHTAGFIKIMSIIWLPTVLWLSICYIGKRLIERW